MRSTPDEDHSELEEDEESRAHDPEECGEHDAERGGEVMTEQTSTAKSPVLDVKDLGVNFWVNDEWWMAAEDLNYTVNAGEVLAIVGESGSGKSQSSMSLLGLFAQQRPGHRLGEDGRNRTHRHASGEDHGRSVETRSRSSSKSR